MQRTLELSFDRLVIGSDLSAFAFCFVNCCPAIYLRLSAPYKHDRYGTYVSDKRLWDDLAYGLTVGNLLPFADKIVSLRIEENNILKAVTKFGVVVTIKYNHLIISDDYNIEGLPPPIRKTDDKNWVIDWFYVRHGVYHNLNEIIDFDNDFVKRIVFHKSERFYHNNKRKDCLTVSCISDAELANGEGDQNLARLKAIKMMKANGLKGVWDKTNRCFLSPKLTSVKREIHPLGKNIYSDLPPNITMLYDSADIILKNERKSEWNDKLKFYGINR
jgi:hypothetical protein